LIFTRQFLKSISIGWFSQATFLETFLLVYLNFNKHFFAQFLQIDFNKPLLISIFTIFHQHSYQFNSTKHISYKNVYWLILWTNFSHIHSHWLILSKHLSNKKFYWLILTFLTINSIGWFKLNIFLTSNSIGWFKLNVFLTSNSIRCIQRVASFHPMFQTAAS